VSLSFQIPFTFGYHVVSSDIAGILRRRAAAWVYFRYANNIVPHDVESGEERLTGWKVFLYKGDSAGKTGKIG
jgi:hypothetical protein